MIRKMEAAAIIALVVIFVVVILQADVFATDAGETLTLSKHLVNYGTIKDENVNYIAKNFDILVTNAGTVDQVKRIRKLRPDLIALLYKDIFAMHPYYDDWAEVNAHEEYFLHDKTLGLRLREKHFGWFVMDISNEGWVTHYTDHVVSKLDALKAFGGIFADDVWKDLYFDRFYVDIKSEESVVNGAGRIVVKYPPWQPSTPDIKNNIHIRIRNQGETDYYGNGSYKGTTISPGVPLRPSTKVYVDYSASDPTTLCPADDKITNWHSNMAGMLEKVKLRLGMRLLIINSNDFSGQFLTKADGMMVEGFGATELKTWEDEVRLLDASTKSGKYYLAQIRTTPRLPQPPQNSSIQPASKDDSPADLANQINYPLASFLIGRGAMSSFSVDIRDSPTLFFEDRGLNQRVIDVAGLSAQLGKPTTGPFVYAEQKNSTSENLLTNGSFENGLAGWSITKKCLDTPGVSSDGQESVHFLADGRCGSTLRSGFIPVRPGTLYTLGASVRARNVSAGNPDWKRLTLIGRFYDRNNKEIPDYFADVEFDLKDYDWKHYSKTYLSPANASFFRITSLGLYPTSSGEGWINGVFFRKNPQMDMYKIYARQFEKGLVLVNPTKAKHTIFFDQPYHDIKGRAIHSVELEQNSAVILLR